MNFYQHQLDHILLLRILVLNINYYFLKDEYFEKYSEKEIFKTIREYVNKYNNIPTLESIYIEISNKNNIHEETLKDIDETFNVFKKKTEKLNEQWLLDTTEK